MVYNVQPDTGVVRWKASLTRIASGSHCGGLTASARQAGSVDPPV